MKRLLCGACAGLAATMPMTWAMMRLHRHLPLWEKRALPPRRIMVAITKEMGLYRRMDEPKLTAATLVSHYGFGAAAGALYAPLAAKRSEPAAVKGVVFGIAVWAVSYLGWLPASGLLYERAPRRQAMMLLSHLVWGLALGVLTEQLESNVADE